MPGDAPAGPVEDNDAQTRRAISDADGVTEADKRDSQLIYDALRRHKDALAGEAKLPAEDRVLSERILAQARNRSAEIRETSRPATSRHLSTGRPLPLWLIVTWIVVAAGMVAAWYLL